jgi:hypothetical protein
MSGERNDTMSQNECFVCGKATPPVPEGFHTRASCNDCRAQARVLPAGVPLGQVLAANDERGRLPTDRLSPVLNPMAISAYRGWAGFAEGDCVIFEEREKCKDWFDFVMQHLDPGPELLRYVAEHKPKLQTAVESLREIAKEFPDRIQVWVRLWLITSAATKVLADRGPIHSTADAFAVLDAMENEPKKLTEEGARALLERLYGLADVDWDD